MSPLSGIPSIMPGTMPQADLMTPRVMPMPSPTEVGKAQELTSAQPASSDFSSMLGRMVSDINAQQVQASQTVGALQSGQNVPLHQAVIAMEEASVSFQLMVEVRNRLLESYQEVMRMQI